MKILFYALTKSQGGIENFIYNYFLHMKKKNLQFSLFATDEKVAYEERFSEMGAELIHLPKKKGNRRNYYKFMSDVIEKGQYDVVWFNDNNLCDITLLQIAKRNRISVRICHSHNSTLNSGVIKRWIHIWNQQHIDNVATELWTCSDKAAEWAYGAEWKKKNVKMIPNAVDMHKFFFDKDKREKVRCELGITNKTVIGHVGRYCVEKNHQFLIKIFEQIVIKDPDSVLILVGQGELLGQVRADVHSKDLNSKVIILGQRDDIEEITRCFDVVIMPSLFEGFPVAIIEAQAAGVPCIISDTITKEVNISGAVRYVSLGENPRKWAEYAVQSAQETNSAQISSLIYESDYNIENSAQTLENWLEKRFDGK